MELNFKYTREEYIDSRRDYLLMSKIITKFSLVSLPIFLAFIIRLITNEFDVISICIGILYAFVEIIIFFLYILQPGMIFDATKKYHHEYFLNFKDDIIHFKTQDITSELKWNIYQKLWENKMYFYLIQTEQIYTMLPKRVFKDEDQQDEFKSLFIKCNEKGIYKKFK